MRHFQLSCQKPGQTPKNRPILVCQKGSSMKSKVVKFGGTSLANVEQFLKCEQIIKADETRRFIVVSAPGKRTQKDIKITDLLIDCHRAASLGESIEPSFSVIRKRFLEIARGLGVGGDLAGKMEEAEGGIQEGASYEYAVSRGEYFTAQIMAEYLGFLFVDAKDIIRFNKDGSISSESYELIGRTLKADRPAVIPGFYGCTADGSVRAFTRGGTDITGALVARGTEAQIYENWTDVSGLLQADPRIVENPPSLGEVTYEEIRVLTALGAKVLHEEAIHPVREAGIPINIRNTNVPEDPGTMIVHEKKGGGKKTIGIAGKTGLTAYRFHRAHLGEDLERQGQLKKGLVDLGWKIIHHSAHFDSFLTVMEPRENNNPGKAGVESLTKDLGLERYSSVPSLSLVGAVGDQLSSDGGRLAASLTTELVQGGERPCFLSHGVSAASFIAGIESENCDGAIRILASACEKTSPG